MHDHSIHLLRWEKAIEKTERGQRYRPPPFPATWVSEMAQDNDDPETDYDTVTQDWARYEVLLSRYQRLPKSAAFSTSRPVAGLSRDVSGLPQQKNSAVDVHVLDSMKGALRPETETAAPAAPASPKHTSVEEAKARYSPYPQNRMPQLGSLPVGSMLLPINAPSASRNPPSSCAPTPDSGVKETPLAPCAPNAGSAVAESPSNVVSHTPEDHPLHFTYARMKISFVCFIWSSISSEVCRTWPLSRRHT